jgi:hypothetical protein
MKFKYLEMSCNGVIEILYLHFPAETEEIQRKPQ